MDTELELTDMGQAKGLVRERDSERDRVRERERDGSTND